MDLFFKMVLPVIWAVAATGIALLLYRTSSALFEESATSSGQTRRVRLVGSVVIAALAFIGLWKATPPELLRIAASDETAVRTADLMLMGESLAQVDTALAKLEACTALTVAAQCQAQIDELRAKAQMLNVARTRLLPPS